MNSSSEETGKARDSAARLDAGAFLMTDFHKGRNCPSSFELLEASAGEVNAEQGLRIAGHLASCDFCDAELAFYTRFAPAEEQIDAPSIPRPLLELAESLIARDTIHIKTLEDLFGTIEGLPFHKAAGRS